MELEAGVHADDDQFGLDAKRPVVVARRLRLYIARDDDPAGDGAMATLVDRAQEVGIEAIVISPRLGDFNEDLRLLGIDALRAASRVQIAAQDVSRFMELAA